MWAPTDSTSDRGRDQVFVRAATPCHVAAPRVAARTDRPDQVWFRVCAGRGTHDDRLPSIYKDTVSNLLKDLRFGVRLLLRSPGYSVVVAFTLALAIGANAIILGFTDLLR